MSYSVTILLGNGRRQKLSVKLNTPILVIIEEICKKQKLDPAQHDLKFHNRILDITSTIQFLGVTNNAQLELVPAAIPRVDRPVTVFLQLENGDRLSGSFLPAQSLWDVITTLCDEETKSKSNPVMIYTRQEVFGDRLKSTTLKMLGLTGGNALLRLLHRTEDQLKNQSVSSIYILPLKPKPVEAVLGKSDTKGPVIEKKESEAKSPVIERKESEAKCPVIERSETEAKDPVIEKIDTGPGSPMDVESSSALDLETDSKVTEAVTPTPIKTEAEIQTPMVVEESIIIKSEPKDEKIETEMLSNFDINGVEYIGERYALMFRVDSFQSPKFKNVAEDDDFYELTIEDAKALLRDVKRTRSELEQADLETSASKARKKSILLERTLSIYPHCVVRILFPNRIILQGVFTSTETIYDVVQFTKSFVQDSSLDFYLYTSPPKRILKLESSLIDIGAVPGINLYFGRDQADYQTDLIIKPEFLDKMAAPEVALEVANHFRMAGRAGKREVVEETPEPGPSSVVTPPTRSSEIPLERVTPKKPAGGAVPKWFKTQ